MRPKYKNKQPLKVSVVIPVYNSEKTIADTLNSILSSSYRPFEIIIIDDCSTDASFQKVDKIGAKFKIIRLDQNMGAGYARNRGAEKATGDILLFVDADIIIRQDTIARIVESYTPGDYECVVGVYGKELVYKNIASVYKNIFLFHQHRSKYQRFWTGCGSIKRDLFIKMGGFDEKMRGAVYEDTLLGYNLMSQGYRIFINHNCQAIHYHRYTFFNVMKNDYTKSFGLSLIFNANRTDNRYYLNLQNVFSMMLSLIFFPSILFSLMINQVILIAFLCFFLIIFINAEFYNEIRKVCGLPNTLLSIFFYIASCIAAFFGALRGILQNGIT